MVLQDEREGLLAFLVAGAPVSLAEVVRTGAEGHVSEMYVARPGKVTAYDPITNTAVVKPMVKHALSTADDDERIYEDLPEIPFVPVMFPRFGTFVITMPVPIDSPVLLLFCDVSLAEWRESGDVSEPVDARRHSLGWPVALMGLFPDISPMSVNPLDLVARAAGMCIGTDGGEDQIRFIGGKIELGHDLATGLAADAMALASRVDALMNAIVGVTIVPGDGGAAIKTAVAAAKIAMGGSVASPLVTTKLTPP